MSYADRYALARKAVAAVDAKGGRKLGANQRGVLSALVVHGNWPSGWIWENRSSTVNLLESLAKRGIVEVTERPMTDYRGRPYIEGHPYHNATTKSYKPAAWLFETV